MKMLDDRKQCFICGSQGQLDIHHCLHGTANRRLADEFGLCVYLCRRCHMDLHDSGKFDKALKQYAQRRFEAEQGSREDFMRIFGRNYL